MFLFSSHNFSLRKLSSDTQASNWIGMTWLAEYIGQDMLALKVCKFPVSFEAMYCILEIQDSILLFNLKYVTK